MSLTSGPPVLESSVSTHYSWSVTVSTLSLGLLDGGPTDELSNGSFPDRNKVQINQQRLNVCQVDEKNYVSKYVKLFAYMNTLTLLLSFVKVVTSQTTNKQQNLLTKIE